MTLKRNDPPPEGRTLGEQIGRLSEAAGLLTNTPPLLRVHSRATQEVVAAFEHLLTSSKEVNASRPGETSGSFINITMRDYGWTVLEHFG